MRQFHLLTLALCAPLFLFPGCRKKETPVEVGNREQIFHLGNGAEPRDLDPHTSTSNTEANILASIFEGLVRFAPDGRTVLPGAAERWDISADGKVYTFHLRSGLKWSNGDALTSEDFLYSFRRIIEPKLASELAVYANWVAGAQDYNEEKSKDLAAVGFRAPDPQTFEITLRERAPFLLALLATNPFYPVHRPSLEKIGAYTRRGAEWTRAGSLVGNGPFVLREWRVNDSLRVEKNPHYWDATHVKLKAAVFHPIDDANAEERAFRGGLLHVTRYLPTTRLEDYHKEHSPLLCADPLVSTKFVEMNTAKAPFDEPAARRTFAHALDREAIVRDVRRDGSRVADSLCVPGSGPNPGYTPRLRLGHEPRRQEEWGNHRDLWLQKDEDKNKPITLAFSTSHQGDQQLCEAMQAMWQKELGLRVELDPQEEKVWVDTMRNKNYQLILMSWSDINDPVALLQLFLHNSPNNYSNWSSPEYDREFAAAGRSATDAERWMHLQNADALLVAELPLVPLYHENQNYLVQPSVRGWQGNILGLHVLHDISLESGR